VPNEGFSSRAPPHFVFLSLASCPSIMTINTGDTCVVCHASCRACESFGRRAVYFDSLGPRALHA
jgi:hypothetical protein